jgi:hypothetical protein
MDLPDGLVEKLNELGFALTELGPVNRFARAAIGSELHLTVEAVGQDRWRLGVGWRQPCELGRTPNPIVPLALERLGMSRDGVTIELPTTDLLGKVPRLLGDCVLPMVDLAPS